jgi:competence protein ComFC
MKHAFSDISKAALNLIFPIYCQGCKAPLAYNNSLFLCRGCLEKLDNPVVSSRVSGEGRVFIKRAYHCCQYEGLIKELIHRFKYNKKTCLKNAFISLLHNLFLTRMASEKIDMIVPVPMHPADEQKRGFNQSAMLAKGLSEKINAVFENILIKSRHTPAQAGLNGAERAANIKGVFSYNKQGHLSDERILIVDDVFTTGSTINECAKTLNRCGAGTILAITLARGA